MTRIQATTAPTEHAAVAPSLRMQAIRGSVWTIAGYGASQVLRFAGNLVLARLLFPEAFGIMALVNILLQGLQMWSDLGIAPCVIQNRRSDRAFLDTAWTLQIVRGVILWLLACLVAWPFASFYHSEILTRLIPVAALAILISGFSATSLYTLNRRLQLGAVTLLELLSQIASIVVMIAWALLDRSVWALAGGSIAGALVRTVLSHGLDRQHRDWFAWNPQAVRAIVLFGRWLFLSSVLTFLCGQADRLMLAKLLDAKRLGLYSMALMLAMLVVDIARQLDGRILFPAYAILVRDAPHMLADRLHRTRRLVVTPTVLAALVLTLLGTWLIHILYDSRYADAGYMLQILAAGVVAQLVCASYGAALLALGATAAIALLLGTQLVLLVGLGCAGFALHGETGFIFGVAAVEWVNYGIVAAVVRRYGLWQPGLDALLLGLSLATLSLALCRSL